MKQKNLLEVGDNILVIITIKTHQSFRKENYLAVLYHLQLKTNFKLLKKELKFDFKYRKLLIEFFQGDNIGIYLDRKSIDKKAKYRRNGFAYDSKFKVLYGPDLFVEIK